jgi:uncharacterized repeat protein (TIGR01451 family)
MLSYSLLRALSEFRGLRRRGTRDTDLKTLRLFVLCAAAAVCQHAAELPVNLGSAGTFTALAGSTVTNTGPTIVNGDVGVSPGSAVTGFPPGTVIGGAIYTGAPGPAATAQIDLTAAYNDAAGRPGPPAAIAGDLGGLTLPAGLYKSTSTIGITGVLTLNGGGNPNAVFIFQIASALTTASGSQIVLQNGAQAANIFWQVGSSATLGTNSIFNGTIMAQASVTGATGAALNGRALARTGAVTLDTNSGINPGPPTLGAPPAALSVACPLASARVGAPYNSLLAASGGVPPYSYSTVGALPTGLILDGSTGFITGTPTGSTATFTAQATDTTPTTATRSCTITVAAASADVSIIKTGPAGATANTNVTYTITVSNAGPSLASTVAVSDVLPAGLTFVSASPSQGSCSGTATVTCSLGNMNIGASATITLVAHTPLSITAISNTATVSSVTADPNSANNTSTASTSPISTVPALSTWGLGLLTLLMAGLGMLVLRRMRTVQD